MVGRAHGRQRAARPPPSRSRFGMPGRRRWPTLLGAAQPRSRWRMEVTDDRRGCHRGQRRLQRQPRVDARRADAPWRRCAARASHRGRCSARCASSGDDSIAEHDEIGRLAVRLDISKLVAVGQGARALLPRGGPGGLLGRGGRVRRPTSTRPSRCCAALVRPGDVVLVKASRDRSGSSAWPTRSCDGGPRMILIVLSRLISLGLALLVHPAAHPGPRRHGYAQAIRESADGDRLPRAQRQARAPRRWAASAIVVAVVLGYFGAHLIALARAHRLGAAGPLPDGRAGARRRSPTTTSRSSSSAAPGSGPAPSCSARRSSRCRFAYLAVQFPDAEGVTPASHAISVPARHRLVLPTGPVPAVDLVPGHRDDQRRQPHRRPRRPGGRRGDR